MPNTIAPLVGVVVHCYRPNSCVQSLYLNDSYRNMISVSTLKITTPFTPVPTGGLVRPNRRSSPDAGVGLFLGLRVHRGIVSPSSRNLSCLVKPKPPPPILMFNLYEPETRESATIRHAGVSDSCVFRSLLPLSRARVR